MKKCSKCDTKKDESEFYRRGNGLQPWCKKCSLEAGYEWSKKNPNKHKSLRHRYYIKYKEQHKTDLEYRQKRTESQRLYAKRHPRRIVFIHRKANCRWANKESIKLKRKEPKYRLNATIRSRIYYALKRKKFSKTWDMLPYTLLQLMQHLEAQFIDGMCWNNYGKWEIDHIRPMASFSFSSVQDIGFQNCWSLNNLRPLWKEDNRAKGAKVQDNQYV